MQPQMQRTRTHRPALVLTLAAAAATAHAGATAYVTDENDQLYRLDMATLQTELVGQIGVEHVYDIAALSDGTIAGQHDDDPGYFIVDSTDLSLLGQASNNASAGFMGDLDALGDRLYSYRDGVLRDIDPMTGQRTTIATQAIPSNAHSIAMISDHEAFIFAYGNLGVRELYRVDFDAGVADLVWDTDDVSFGYLSIDYADGVLYGLDRDGILSAIDQNDGSLTTVGQIGISNVDSFTIVPAPTTAGVLALAGLLGARRRR